MIYFSNSEKETERIGGEIIETFKESRIFLLQGELGTGKTVMIRGMVRKLGIDDNVSSPSFVIVKEYKNKDICVYHLDLYRVDSGYETTDFYDMLNSDCYLFVEWGEKVKHILKNIPYVFITIEDTGVNKRRIKVENFGN